MSRYVNLDEATTLFRGIDTTMAGSFVADTLESLPTIDIVMCKDCRWGKSYSDKQLECDALGLGGLKFPNDFCSYGERIDNE